MHVTFAFEETFDRYFALEQTIWLTQLACLNDSYSDHDRNKLGALLKMEMLGGPESCFGGMRGCLVIV